MSIPFRLPLHLRVGRRPQRVASSAGSARRSAAAAIVALAFVTGLPLLAGGAAAQATVAAPDRGGPITSERRAPRPLDVPMVRLPNHVVPTLAQAIVLPPTAVREAQALTLTLVLRRDDAAGFERYLHDVYDPGSAEFRHFHTQAELSKQFGPSRRTYHHVRAYLRAHGLASVGRSRNRLTLTVRGTRAAVERAFALRIRDYAIGDRTFYANDGDPALPATLAIHVAAITGLSSSTRPTHVGIVLPALFCLVVLSLLLLPLWFINPLAGLAGPILAGLICGGLGAFLFNAYGAQQFGGFGSQMQSNLRTGGLRVRASAAAASLPAATGAGQTIGIVAFDTFDPNDVRDYLALIGLPASVFGNLGTVPVNGGVAAPGPGAGEVLLDVDTIMSIAPGAHTVVYDAPFDGRATSYSAVFNAMIDDGVTIISNSWASCEDQVSTAEAQGIDAVLQSAAASGISVFNGSGDTGSTCLDGSPDTISVPADSPHATAVGGTTLIPGPGLTYGTERWWDGSASLPMTGQGGFGVSRHFPRPSYQDGHTTAAGRSIPDVVAYADPVRGRFICQASTGGCPNGLIYGGTSMSAPQWAGLTALLNERQGSNLGALNPLIYPLAGTDAFHDAASMASDFAHVGLGSPNANVMHVLLSGATVGPADAAVSTVQPLVPDIALVSESGDVPADGATAGGILVQLLDANGNIVSGKTITLAADGGDAVITPVSGVTTVANGTVVFQVTDLTAETVIFTATDTSDGLPLQQTATLTFGVPPAASAGIQAFPTTVTADGASTTTITVTLTDALGRPTPGKRITLSQGPGHSLISGPSPAVTDAGGHIQFTATDQVNETVTYTAVDVTDGNLPVPGSAQVTFGNGAGNACGQNVTPPTGLNGYTATPWATGFKSGALSFGNVNFGGCAGVLGPAFHDDSAYVLDFFNGDVFKLGTAGGSASSADLLATIGPTLGWPVFSKSGRLYATRVATTGNFTTGAVLELDPDTGAVLRTVAANAICAQGLVADPLSGDLFFDDQCFGAGSDNASLFRIRDPDSANPTVEVYATLPATPNGQIAVSPKGTFYVVSSYTQQNPPVLRVSGTDQPQPPTVTTLPGVISNYWVSVAGVGPDGEATSLVTLSDGKLHLLDLTTNPPAIIGTIADNTGGGFIGPDGCLYMPNANVIYKLTDPSGGCSFLPTSAGPALTLTPASVAPSPPQGSTRTFTATFHNVDVPANTAVFFQVTGANQRVRMVQSTAEGNAVFTYSGALDGTDAIVATATVDGNELVSNRARVTWDAGKHTTFLTLNPSPTAGKPGQTLTLRASLTDVSVDPAAAIPQVHVELTVGNAHCTATTDADGIAVCDVTLGGPGFATLSASFAGTSQFLPASSDVGFGISGPAASSRFMTYQTKPTRNGPKFSKLGPVVLGDEAFGTTAGYDVVKLIALATPADQNDEGIPDPTTYLASYGVKLAKGSPKPQKRRDLDVGTECGTIVVTAAAPANLLVPTAEDPVTPVTAPVESAHNVDHMLCYRVKVQKKRTDGTSVATFPKGVQVEVADPLNALQPRRYDLTKVVVLCNPVTKAGSPTLLSGPDKGTSFPLTPATVRNPDARLVCYAAKLAKKLIPQTGCGPTDPKGKGARIKPAQEKHVPLHGLHVANQLGTGLLDTRKETLLCLPALAAQ